MEALNLPAYELKVAEKNGKMHIYDVFRKTWLVLTSEEWVRQNFLTWLVKDMGYPVGLIAVEKSLQYNTLKKRADAVVYSPDGQPLMLIECKAPAVAITQKTLEQAALYNFRFNTPFLALTNGIDHYCCVIDREQGSLAYLPSFPLWQQMTGAGPDR